MRTRPTRDETLINVAFAVEAQSTCDRNHVGAVVARDGRIISTGYNGAPAGMPHCVHVGKPGPVPPYITGCRVAVHAEANAIAYAARGSTSIEGATIYTTLSPCFACAQLVVAAGLIRVVYVRAYRDLTGVEFLISAGLTVERLTM